MKIFDPRLQKNARFIFRDVPDYQTYDGYEIEGSREDVNLKGLRDSVLDGLETTPVVGFINCNDETKTARIYDSRGREVDAIAEAEPVRIDGISGDKLQISYGPAFHKKGLIYPQMIYVDKGTTASGSRVESTASGSESVEGFSVGSYITLSSYVTDTLNWGKLATYDDKGLSRGRSYADVQAGESYQITDIDRPGGMPRIQIQTDRGPRWVYLKHRSGKNLWESGTAPASTERKESGQELSQEQKNILHNIEYFFGIRLDGLNWNESFSTAAGLSFAPDKFTQSGEFQYSTRLESGKTVYMTVSPTAAKNPNFWISNGTETRQVTVQNAQGLINALSVIDAEMGSGSSETTPNNEFWTDHGAYKSGRMQRPEGDYNYIKIGETTYVSLPGSEEYQEYKDGKAQGPKLEFDPANAEMSPVTGATDVPNPNVPEGRETDLEANTDKIQEALTSAGFKIEISNKLECPGEYLAGPSSLRFTVREIGKPNTAQEIILTLAGGATTLSVADGSTAKFEIKDGFIIPLETTTPAPETAWEKVDEMPGLVINEEEYYALESEVNALEEGETPALFKKVELNGVVLFMKLIFEDGKVTGLETYTYDVASKTFEKYEVGSPAPEAAAEIPENLKKFGITEIVGGITIANDTPGDGVLDFDVSYTDADSNEVTQTLTFENGKLEVSPFSVGNTDELKFEVKELGGGKWRLQPIGYAEAMPANAYPFLEGLGADILEDLDTVEDARETLKAGGAVEADGRIYTVEDGKLVYSETEGGIRYDAAGGGVALPDEFGDYIYVNVVDREKSIFEFNSQDDADAFGEEFEIGGVKYKVDGLTITPEVMATTTELTPEAFIALDVVTLAEGIIIKEGTKVQQTETDQATQWKLTLVEPDVMGAGLGPEQLVEITQTKGENPKLTLRHIGSGDQEFFLDNDGKTIVAEKPEEMPEEAAPNKYEKELASFQELLYELNSHNAYDVEFNSKQKVSLPLGGIDFEGYLYANEDTRYAQFDGQNGLHLVIEMQGGKPVYELDESVRNTDQHAYYELGEEVQSLGTFDADADIWTFDNAEDLSTAIQAITEYWKPETPETPEPKLTSAEFRELEDFSTIKYTTDAEGGLYAESTITNAAIEAALKKSEIKGYNPETKELHFDYEGKSYEVSMEGNWQENIRRALDLPVPLGPIELRPDMPKNLSDAIVPIVNELRAGETDYITYDSDDNQTGNQYRTMVARGPEGAYYRSSPDTVKRDTDEVVEPAADQWWNDMVASEGDTQPRYANPNPGAEKVELVKVEQTPVAVGGVELYPSVPVEGQNLSLFDKNGVALESVKDGLWAYNPDGGTVENYFTLPLGEPAAKIEECDKDGTLFTDFVGQFEFEYAEPEEGKVFKVWNVRPGESIEAEVVLNDSGVFVLELNGTQYTPDELEVALPKLLPAEGMEKPEEMMEDTEVDLEELKKTLKQFVGGVTANEIFGHVNFVESDTWSDIFNITSAEEYDAVVGALSTLVQVLPDKRVSAVKVITKDEIELTLTENGKETKYTIDVPAFFQESGQAVEKGLKQSDATTLLVLDSVTEKSDDPFAGSEDDAADMLDGDE